jgi:site-specific DNA-methyltransferase (adenine-specific)
MKRQCGSTGAECDSGPCVTRAPIAPAFPGMRAKTAAANDSGSVPWEVREGECVEGMSALPDRYADVVITDPPYEAEAHTSQRLVARGHGKLELEPLTFPPITEELREQSARQMARLARRWILVFCQVEAAMKWRAALEAGGAVYKRTCQWIKPDGKPQYSGDRPGIGYESIVACHAPGRSRWNGGGSHGVFIVNKGGDARTGHQTQKPLALMELLVRRFSDRGDLVLDPFVGSGSTGVAAVRQGRRFFGWEMNPEYVAIARKRLSTTREQLEMDVWPPSKDLDGATGRSDESAKTRGDHDGEAEQLVLCADRKNRRR